MQLKLRWVQDGGSVFYTMGTLVGWLEPKWIWAGIFSHLTEDCNLVSHQFENVSCEMLKSKYFMLYKFANRQIQEYYINTYTMRENICPKFLLMVFK